MPQDSTAECPCALHERFGRSVIVDEGLTDTDDVTMTEHVRDDGKNLKPDAPSLETIATHLLKGMSQQSQSAALHQMRLLDGFIEDLEKHEEWTQTGHDNRADAPPEFLPHDAYLDVVSKLLQVHTTAARQIQSFDSFLSLLPRTFSELAPIVWRNQSKVIFAHFGKLSILPPQQPIPEGHTLLNPSPRASTLIQTLDQIEHGNRTGEWVNPRGATLGLRVKVDDPARDRANHSITEPHLTPSKSEQASIDMLRMWADTAMLPHEAICGGWSYCVVLLADLHWRQLEYSATGPPTLLQSGCIRNQLIGELPIVVGSRFCYTHKLRPNAMLAIGECPQEVGGHLIIRGRLKVMVMPERPRPNQLLVVIKTTGAAAPSGPNGSTSGDYISNSSTSAAAAAARSASSDTKRPPLHTGVTNIVRTGLNRDPDSLPKADPYITPGSSISLCAMQHDETVAQTGGAIMPQGDPHSCAHKFLHHTAQVQSVAEYGCFSPSMFTVQFGLSHSYTSAVSARKGMTACVGKTVPVTPPLLVLRATFHRVRDSIPVIAILRALGAGTDSQIGSMIVQDEMDHDMLALLQPSFANAAAEGVTTEQQALMLIHNMVQTRPPGEAATTKVRVVACDSSIGDLSVLDRSYVFKMLQLHLLPHVGVTTASRGDKIVYICYVIREFLRVVLGRRSADVRDMYRNKSLQTIGLFMRNIAFKAFHHIRSQIEGTFLVLIRSLYTNKEECDRPGVLAKAMTKLLKVSPSPFTAHTLFVLTNGNVPNSNTGGAIPGAQKSHFLLLLIVFFFFHGAPTEELRPTQLRCQGSFSNCQSPWHDPERRVFFVGFSFCLQPFFGLCSIVWQSCHMFRV